MLHVEGRNQAVLPIQRVKILDESSYVIYHPQAHLPVHFAAWSLRSKQLASLDRLLNVIRFSSYRQVG